MHRVHELIKGSFNTGREPVSGPAVEKSQAIFQRNPEAAGIWGQRSVDGLG